MERLRYTAMLVGMMTTVLAFVGCADRSQEKVQARPVALQAEQANPSDQDSSADLLANQWGIKIEFATLSAGGYMVDFRFRVLDATKAQPILDRTIKPYLVDQSTGAKFAVPTPPKVGQLRSGGNITDGTVCFVYFANPSRYVKSGNKVTVVIGDFEARDIVVE